MEGPAGDFADPLAVFVLNLLMAGVGSLHGGAGVRHSSPPSPYPIIVIVPYPMPSCLSQRRQTQFAPTVEFDKRNARSPMEGPAGDFAFNPVMAGTGSLHGRAFPDIASKQRQNQEDTHGKFDKAYTSYTME
jgi:hypothetical protein